MRDLGRMPERGGLTNFYLNVRGAQTFQRGRKKLARAPAARHGIHNRKIFIYFGQSSLTADRSSEVLISSASSLRLIFNEAVRGKSLPQSK